MLDFILCWKSMLDWTVVIGVGHTTKPHGSVLKATSARDISEKRRHHVNVQMLFIDAVDRNSIQNAIGLSSRVKTIWRGAMSDVTGSNSICVIKLVLTFFFRSLTFSPFFFSKP